MPTAAIIALIIIIAIMLIIAYFWLRHSYKKGKKEGEAYNKQAEKILPNLENTNIHLKYKNKFLKQIIINIFSSILLSLGIIFLLYLPIFKIEYELLGIKIGETNFSFYDNYIAVKNALNNAAHIYTDIDKSTLLTIIIFATLVAIIMTVDITDIALIKKYNSDNALSDFLDAKIDKKEFLNRSEVVCVLIAFGAIIFGILKCRSSKYDLPENATFNIEQIDNYLYYYSTSGGSSFKVFQNNFKFCNGVSTLIILPIICSVVGIILFIISRYLKNKLVAEIQNEKLDEPQTVETTNENDNIE